MTPKGFKVALSLNQVVYTKFRFKTYVCFEGLATTGALK